MALPYNWNRRLLVLVDGGNDIDTLITQANLGVDPPLGIPGTAPPPDGTEPASRILVLPLLPLSAWGEVTMSEPYFNTTTQTVHVVFTAAAATQVRVAFVNPHSLWGLGRADPYNSDLGCDPPIEGSSDSDVSEGGS